MPPLPDDRLAADADPDEARGYIIAHDARVVRLDTMSDAELLRLYHAALHLRGMSLLLGEGYSHDELVNAIVDLEFPDVTRAREIWYRHTMMPALGQE